MTLTLLLLGIQTTFKAIEITKKENREKLAKAATANANFTKVQPVIENDAGND